MSRTVNATATLLATCLTIVSSFAGAQAQKIPIYNLESTTMRSTEPLASVYGVRELPNGNLLVNDPVAHRLLVLNPKLDLKKIVADSTSTTGVKFPQYGTRMLIPFIADSVLFIDNDSRVFLVIDPLGNVARPMAPPKSNDLGYFNAPFVGAPGVDANGRLVYQAGRRFPAQRVDPKVKLPSRAFDTLSLIAVNLETRIPDTIAALVIPRASGIETTVDANGKMHGTQKLTPVAQPADIWAVLSDGTVAIVRGHDYHVESIRANGNRVTGTKMPFDWRRLTDDDKRARVDSVKRIIDSLQAAGSPLGRMIQSQTVNGVTRTDTVIPAIEYPTLAEIPDFVPPVRANAARPDRDGMLWILPTTSNHVTNGLLYDVVSADGQLVKRVQLPPDRDIVGFGKNGVVFLGWFHNRVWTIERTRIANAASRQ
ncbi:MAG: hypothetical protein ABJB66_07225 [Gemmatimonadaceae bacterium]